VTLAGSAGTQKVTSKAAALADAVSVNEATASVDTFDTTTGSTTTTTTTSSTGSNFVLSTSVDAVSGTANNDVIVGLIGTSGTFTVGDNIDGGSGTDTLNLIDASGTAGGFVSINGVETINVRTLVTAGVDVTELNAIDWSGVATLSNASSFSDSKLNVSGLSITTQVRLSGNTDIDVDFSNTTTGSVSVAIVGSGVYDSTASTLGSASGAATANIDLNDSVEGLISGVAISLVGSSLARIEAGTAATNFTVSGAGNAVLVTDDTITSFNASQASGNIDVSFSGASDLTVVGGAGNDTFRLGATISNNDSVNGGAGTDTVTLSIGGFSRSLATSLVESGTVTFNDDGGGTLNATASTIAAFSLKAGSAGADANIAGLVGGAVINLTSDVDNFDAVSVNAASGASSLTLNIGSASGNVSFSALSVTDAASVNVVIASNSTGTVALGSASFDADAKAVNIRTTDGDGELTLTNFEAAGATAITVTSNGSAGITFTSGLENASALTSLVVSAGGSDGADISLDDLGKSATAASFTSLSLSGQSGADVSVGTVRWGNGVTAAGAGTITMVAGNGSDVGTTAMDITTSGAFALTLSLNAQASGDIAIGSIDMTPGTAATAAASAVSLTISAMTIGANGSVVIDDIEFDTAGAQLNLGAITVGTSAGFSLGSGGSGISTTSNAVDVDVSNITLSLGADASAEIGTILTTAGAVGNISVTVADSASANFDSIVASALGSITISAVGDGEVNISGGLTIGSNIGAISITLADEADVTVANFTAGGDVGSITIAGAASATANFGNINASSIGAITVSGAGFVDFGTISAVAVGSINVAQMTSGTFNIDLSAVTNAVEISLGKATNTVLSGVGNDVFTLTAGITGNDNVQYSTATQGVDNIIGFFAGSTGLDQIELDASEIGGTGGLRDSDGVAITTGTVAVDLSVVINGTGASASLTTTDNVIVIGTAFASTAAMTTFMSTAIALGTANLVGSGNFIVTWTDGSDSYLSLVGFDNDTSGHATLASATLTTQTLAVLQGVTPGALVAANFDFV